MADIFDVKTVKGRFFFTVFGVVLVIALFILTYMMPQRNKMIKLEKELSQVENERRLSEMKLKNLGALIGNLPLVLRERRTVENLIPESHEETEIVEFCHYLAALHNVDIESIDVTSPQPLPLASVSDDKKTEQEKELDNKLVRALKKIDTTIRIGGKFSDILGFLDEFKRSNRYFEVYKVGIPEEVTIRELPDSLPMIINGFFYFYSTELSEEKAKGDAFEAMLEAEGISEKYIERRSSSSDGGKTEVSPDLFEELEEMSAQETETGEEAQEPDGDAGEVDGNNEENAGTIDSNGTTESGKADGGEALVGMVQAGFVSGERTCLGMLFPYDISFCESVRAADKVVVS
ncbi:hypothetical protein J7K50_06480 [bacterium]|nr:hypothetical protein [bacterium]